MIQGQIVRITANFKNEAGTLADPTSVYFRYKALNATTEHQYGVGVQITKASTGIYYIELDTTAYFGELSYRWYSTGTGQTTHSTDTIEVEKAEP